MQSENIITMRSMVGESIFRKTFLRLFKVMQAVQNIQQIIQNYSLTIIKKPKIPVILCFGFCFCITTSVVFA